MSTAIFLNNRNRNKSSSMMHATGISRRVLMYCHLINQDAI